MCCQSIEYSLSRRLHFHMVSIIGSSSSKTSDILIHRNKDKFEQIHSPLHREPKLVRNNNFRGMDVEFINQPSLVADTHSQHGIHVCHLTIDQINFIEYYIVIDILVNSTLPVDENFDSFPSFGNQRIIREGERAGKGLHLS